MTSAHAPVEGLVFDLDGTLVDSLPDLAEAINQLMAVHGLPAHTPLAVAHMVGKGVRVLVAKAFLANGVTPTDPFLAAAIDRYLGFYEPRATRLTRLFPFVAETVRALAPRYALAVCTNKPTAVSRAIVEAFGLGADIPVVVGGDSGVPPKPEPDMLWLTARRLSLPPERCLMIGDSGNDVVSARAAGLPVALVRYGYTDVPADQLGADFVVDDFRGLSGVLATLA
jgi:phosphoglycolate phosphatase